ncbi:MAG: methylated-DNA--[protein]-cysteine S-methyltransferase [Firmicutes bacterium]|nr:methylated-DNA--[protein]-cysteine S-methyltransferase [Bacillota bacterium]
MENQYFEWESPLGTITIIIDKEAINGLWFNGQKHFCAGYNLENMEKLDNPSCQSNIANEIIKWLEIYFEGKKPNFNLKINFIKGTACQMAVWEELSKIPYGKTITYGCIAKSLRENTNFKKASARSIGGGCVGKNPISIIVPCHRVVGAKGAMTGFAGGLDKKETLLRLEGIINDH